MYSIWSRLQLRTQVTIVSVALLAGSTIVGAAINVRHQQSGLSEDLLKNGMALGRSLASSLSNNVVLTEYDELEEILLKTVEFPEVESLKIIDLNGVVLSHVKKINPETVQVQFSNAEDFGPPQLKNTDKPISFLEKNTLAIWYPLKSSSVLGWLNINISFAELKSRRNHIIVDNVVGASIVIIIDVLVLLFVLIKPTRKIGRAIEVAEQLDTINPPHTSEMGGSYELNKLFSALNGAAKRLKLQHQKIENNTNELRESNLKLAHSKERFDRAINGSNDGLWDCDIQKSLVWCSSRFNALLGYEAKSTQISMDEFIRYFDPKDKCSIDPIFKFINTFEKTLDERCKLKCNDGNYIWFRIRGRLYYDSEGIPVDLAGSIMDISEQVRVEAMKDEFVATVSHELRTPLTSIRGSLALITGGAVGGVDKKMTSMLEIADRNTERLLNIINDILDMSKIEAGKVIYHFEEMELVEFIKESIELNHGLAETHKASLKLITDLKQAWVSTDGGRLNQIMNNLISNAVKFSGEGGNVTLRLSQYKGYYRLAVEDNGSGIKKSYQPFLFNKFTQEQSSQTRETGGTGLGLAITKVLIEQLGGKISYSTIQGKGTTFFIDLPILNKAFEQFTKG